MIPVKLAVKNFMPYRDNVPPLYFNDIHTASIWGDNGNGKSSLMDAITWALWGKTRAKSDDDIIHLGQNETQVEFDFSVSGTLYRVIRKHGLPKRKGGSGPSALDFQVSDDGANFRSIAGNTMTETQQAIIDVLRMDYSTFVNSAYLRQGHADEFTQQQPVKRKEVLSNILGLSKYDRLEDRAREQARKKEVEKTLAENAIADIGEELARKPEYEAELEVVQKDLAAVDAVAAEKEKALSALRQRKELLDTKRQQIKQAERHMAESLRTKELLENQLKQLNTRIKEYEALISQRTAIEDGFTGYTDAKTTNEALNEKYRQVTGLNEKKHALELEIMKAGQALASQKTVVENNITRLKETSERRESLKADMVKAQDELAGLKGDEESIEHKKQEVRDRQTQIAELEVTGTSIRKEVDGIEEKLELLSSQTDAKCPLCERELGEEHRAIIIEKYRNDKEEKTALLQKTREEYARRSKEIKAEEAAITEFEKKLNESRTTIRNRISVIERDMAEVEKAGTQLEEERIKLAGIEKQMADKEYAAEAQAALKEIEAGLAAAGYDAAKHEAVAKELEDLVKFEEPKRKLDEALKNIDTDRETSAKTAESIQGYEKSIEEDGKRKEELERETASLPDMENELSVAENEYREAAGQQKTLQESVGRLKGILQRSAELEQRVKEKRKQLDEVVKEEQIFRDLARAFGKRGIQMWLIETAIPEIEIEANRLLQRMTDNRMHVKIETQKETKRGTTLETLDINISDELGIRNYEMFSGGEAFRIDFAIRIALSKLLARRAGAPLPTLIIDEGFGTQDANGLEKLKEAIISIQDDFEKILVVTHIEEFRDAFPTRIDIVKTPDGSTIEVN